MREGQTDHVTSTRGTASGEGPGRSVDLASPRPLQVRARGPLSPPPSPPSATTCLSLVPAGPHTTQENRRCLHGLAAPNEKAQFVLNGLWIWRESLGIQIRTSGIQMGSRCGPLDVSAPAPEAHLGESLPVLQKAEGQGCVQTPWEPRFRAQSAQLSLPFLFLSFAFLFLLHSCGIRLFSWPLLCLSLLYLSVSQCPSVSLTTFLTLWQCPTRSVSCSQTVSDSMSVLHFWLALPPSSWLPPKASVLPSMLG